VEDVVRTRVYLRDANACEEVARAHGRVFGDIRPANTFIQAGALIGGYEIEIEADAVVDG
jgi:enamine deaminase RidA (YjgF/YER057c/UK114 family)